MILKLSKPEPCDECGSSPVFHRSRYLTVVVNGVVNYFHPPTHSFKKIKTKLHHLENKVSLPIFYACIKLGFAKKTYQGRRGDSTFGTNALA